MDSAVNLKDRKYVIISLILSILYSGAMLYFRYGFENSGIIKTALFIVRTVLMFFLFYKVIIHFTYKLPKFIFADPDKSRKKGLIRNTLLFAIIWLPFVLIKYPAAIHPDTWQGIWQFRNSQIEVQQPVTYIVSVGLFLKIFGNNAGIFLYSLIGYLMYSFSFGYLLTYIEKFNISKVTGYVLIFLFAFSPFTFGYIGVVVKDIQFISALIVFVTLLCELSLQGPLTMKKNVLLFISALIMYLFRPNGLHILLIVLLFFIISLIRKKVTIKPAAFIAAAVVCGYVITLALNSAFNVTRPADADKEMLSIPFQQTARFARDYGDEVTDEQKEIINGVIPYDSLAERYDPRIADPVRWDYSGDKAALKKYFGVWFEQFMSHPGCYIDAFLEQNYYLLCPITSTDNNAFYEGITVFYELDNKFDTEGSWMYDPIFSQPETLDTAKAIVSSICLAMMKLPVPWITANAGICDIALLFCLLMSLFLYRRHSLIYYVPVIAPVLMVMLAPANHGQPRYLFPVLYLIPLLLIILLKDISGKNQ